LFGRVIEQQVIEPMPKFYERVGIDFTNAEEHTVVCVPAKKKAPTP